MSAEAQKARETPAITIRQLLQLAGQNRVYTVRPSATVNDMAKVWKQHEIGALLVVGDEDNLMGIVTERDGAWKVLAEDRLPSSVRVGEIMTPLKEIISVSLEDDVMEVARLMKEHNYRFRHAPAVREEDIYEGIVSIKDLFDYILGLLEERK